MLQEEEPLNQSILWELYKTVRNILLILESDPEAALERGPEFNKLFNLHLEIQISDLGKQITKQTLTSNVVSGILPPILLIKLQSSKKAIKSYLLNIPESSEEHIFYTTLLNDSASSEETNKACIALARLFPYRETDFIAEMIIGTPDTKLAAFEITQK